jgi:hypothetical protein
MVPFGTDIVILTRDEACVGAPEERGRNRHVRIMLETNEASKAPKKGAE